MGAADTAKVVPQVSRAAAPGAGRRGADAKDAPTDNLMHATGPASRGVAPKAPDVTAEWNTSKHAPQCTNKTPGQGLLPGAPAAAGTSAEDGGAPSGAGAAPGQQTAACMVMAQG